MFDPWMLSLAKIVQQLWRIEDYVSDAIVLRLASDKSVRQLVQLENLERTEFETLNPLVVVDTGNLAVTVVSLVFMRILTYFVNAINVDWIERPVYCRATFLLFRSFQTEESIMMTNKRNMLLEKISFIFLVPRDDVSQTRRLTEDGNEHFYVLWRMILREFNMEKLIRIVQKSIINIQAMFDSGLVTSRSNILFKGYQQSFPDFIEN